MFQKLVDFVKTFLIGAGVISLLEWFKNPENIGKIQSLFRFLKDWWPVLVTGLLLLIGTFVGPGALWIAGIALVAAVIPSIVNGVKSIFGMGKNVDKELDPKKGEQLAQDGVDGVEKGAEKGALPDEVKEGEKKVDEMKNLQEPQKFKEGGFVSGPAGEDKVPARLTAGEFVMSKGAVQQYGVDHLAGMNAAAGGTNKPEEGIDSIKPMKGGGPVMPQTPMVRGYSGGGEVKPPEEVKVEDKKKQAPELNKETGKLAKRIEPLVTAQPPGMGGIGGALMSVAEKHPAVMLAKGIGKFIGKGMGKVGDMMKKKEPDLDLKEAIADLQKRFNYSIYDGNYKPQGGVVSEPKESGGGGSDPLAGFVSAVSTLPIVGKPLAKATGVLVSGVEKIIDDKLQLSGNQSGTATPDAPTKPTTTVAYQDAQAAAQGGGGGGGYSAGAGGKVPQFSASAKLSKQKIKVLGISR